MKRPTGALVAAGLVAAGLVAQEGQNPPPPTAWLRAAEKAESQGHKEAAEWLRAVPANERVILVGEDADDLIAKAVSAISLGLLPETVQAVYDERMFARLYTECSRVSFHVYLHGDAAEHVLDRQRTETMLGNRLKAAGLWDLPEHTYARLHVAVNTSNTSDPDRIVAYVMSLSFYRDVENRLANLAMQRAPDPRWWVHRAPVWKRGHIGYLRAPAPRAHMVGAPPARVHMDLSHWLDEFILEYLEVNDPCPPG